MPNTDPANVTVSTASAQAIALARFIETTLIVLLPGGLLAALGAFQQQSACVAGPATAAGCSFHWEAIFFAFVTSIVAGLVNALTSFIGKTHQIATTPQAIVAQTIPAPGDNQSRPQTIVGVTAPAPTVATPVAIVHEGTP